MKRLILAIALTVMTCGILRAQSAREEVLGVRAEVDSLLVGRTIYDVMPACVNVNVTREIRQALENIVIGNADRMFNGFRIRIFQSSAQTAREASLKAMTRFHGMFPDVPVYRSYTAPFFRVVAGNYRAKIDAEEALASIRANFPEAVVVRDKFKYPAL